MALAEAKDWLRELSAEEAAKLTAAMTTAVVRPNRGKVEPLKPMHAMVTAPVAIAAIAFVACGACGLRFCIMMLLVLQ